MFLNFDMFVESFESKEFNICKMILKWFLKFKFF